jgi:hypothetical protein
VRRAAAAATALAAAFAAAAPTRAAKPAVLEFRLENGLEVLVRRVDGAEHVALVTLFDVGARDDGSGECGLAHLMEHLHVTCAAGDAPARTAESAFARYPAGWNAQTGWDYTVVAAVVRPDALEAELRDAAARMRDLRIEASDLAREVPRVVEELRNMYGRIPALGAANHAGNLAGGTDDRPHGGQAEDVRAIPLARVRARREVYGAANARLAVAGDVDPTAVAAAVRRAFADVPGGSLLPPDHRPPPRPSGEGPLAAERRAAFRGPAHVAVGMATRLGDVLPWTDRDLARWLVFASRLLAAAPFGTAGGPAFSFAPLDRPRVLTLSTPVLAGESPAEALRRIDGWIEKAATPPITRADRERAAQAFGFLLGWRSEPRVERQNVYAVAFRFARSRQMGLPEPEAIRKAIDALTDDDLARLRRVPVARVTLLPEE